MATHPVGSNPDSYAERLRAKSVQIHAAATPSRHNRVSGDNARFNNWEKGIASEARPHGTRMPILDKHGSTIPIKRFTEMTKERSSHEARRSNAARTAGETNG